MNWLFLVAYFFGGLLLTNAIPHLVSGMMGQPFQSPFARPAGKGLSSSVVNVLWGFFNVVLGYLLVAQVGSFDLKSIPDALVVGIAILLRGVLAARHYGQYHGGNLTN